MFEEGISAMTTNQLIRSFYEAINAGDEKLYNDFYRQLSRRPDIDPKTLEKIHTEWILQSFDPSYGD